MNDHEAAVVLGVLTAAWPKQDLPDATVDLWLSLLTELDLGDARAAANTVVRQDQWFPAVARFLEVAGAAKRARQHREAEHRGLPDASAVAVAPPAELTEAARRLIAEQRATRHDHHGPDPCPVCGGVATPRARREAS